MLTFILHLFIGATLAGVGIVVVLVAGYSSAWLLGGAVVAGMVIAFPVARVVAKALDGGSKDP